MNSYIIIIQEHIIYREIVDCSLVHSSLDALLKPAMSSWLEVSMRDETEELPSDTTPQHVPVVAGEEINSAISCY